MKTHNTGDVEGEGGEDEEGQRKLSKLISRGTTHKDWEVRRSIQIDLHVQKF